MLLIMGSKDWFIHSGSWINVIWGLYIRSIGLLIRVGYIFGGDSGLLIEGRSLPRNTYIMRILVFRYS
jgi:hypothetical protein